MHLTADEFVDLADGTRAESSVPHLASCDACRRQLAELRVTMDVAAQADVPEPSPLFWDHFSARVRDAVASEGLPRETWWQRLWSWPGVLMPLSSAAAAVLIFAVVFNGRNTAPPDVRPPVAVNRSTPTPPASADPSLELLSEWTAADDASLMLVAELAADLGLDAAADAGLTASGSAEHAVAHLDGNELLELKRLLNEELVRKGA